MADQCLLWKVNTVVSQPSLVENLDSYLCLSGSPPNYLQNIDKLLSPLPSLGINLYLSHRMYNLLCDQHICIHWFYFLTISGTKPDPTAWLYMAHDLRTVFVLLNG